MTEKDLKAIQASIRQKGFTWRAGPTSVSGLTAEEQKARLGLRVEKEELEAMARAIEAKTQLETFRVPVAAPAVVDWRNKGGDWTTPIKDQANCGSCVAFGTAATIEARINIACGNSNMDIDLSEAHLFYCGCGNCCETGWNFAPALDFCKNTGVGLEASFPYTPGNQPCKAGVAPYIKILGWSSVLTVSDRKNILATKGPMVGGMAVYADFFSYSGGVYRHVSGGLAGYHAISVVGYDDNEQCWICKNSWGPGWGDNGWFKIGYGECQMDTNFAFYDVDLNCPAANCDKYKLLAARYALLFRQTGNRKYLCSYYRQLAAYYSCQYKATKNRKYLCLYYRYMAEAYYCQYIVSKDIRYLEYYKKYLAAYHADSGKARHTWKEETEMRNINSGCCEEEPALDLPAFEEELSDEALELSRLEDDLLLTEEVEAATFAEILPGEELEPSVPEGELPLDGELEIPVLETGEEINIDTVISTLKKYPGLKITFSL